ncbi:hypothetical protein RJ640_023210 [Escallonia rubra]|uniref:non-specific serine/threonine protein kinase n=1 Tax=Escallonia rubra TaxID=112253 RepID=A0AA88RJ02_9ASTE|nr:hypothetical protein RJ640_023210 [Escallonia rubra]
MMKCFNDKLGEGGYGSVFKAKLQSGYFVAVKLLGKSKARGQDFICEVGTIGRIHHVNVVQLIGCCAEGSKRALVYEFMPNASLDKFIFSRGETKTPLSWDTIYEIALGVALGIENLHRGCDMQILHFDIKPHNIILDENFVPKISDLGLAKVYSTDDSGDMELGNVSEDVGKLTRKMTLVALWCIQMKPVDRPSMSEVLDMLEGEARLLHIPPKPTFYPQEISVVEDHGISSSSSYIGISITS